MKASFYKAQLNWILYIFITHPWLHIIISLLGEKKSILQKLFCSVLWLNSILCLVYCPVFSCFRARFFSFEIPSFHAFPKPYCWNLKAFTGSFCMHICSLLSHIRKHSTKLQESRFQFIKHSCSISSLTHIHPASSKLSALNHVLVTLQTYIL